MRLAVFLALTIVSLLALTAGPASAATHEFTATFGEAPPYSLTEPVGVAIDNSAGTSRGDSYVADPANHWVQKFDSAGNLIWIAGKAVNKTAVEAAGAEAEQNLCVIASTDVCQSGAAASTPGAFEAPTFLAVDSSTSASAGDIYVADTADQLITKLAPDGSLIEVWGEGGQLAGSSATGTGNLETGSPLIESLTTETGAFAVGQEISAPGIPTGTRITSVNSGSLEISESATATEAASLSAHQSFGAVAGIAVDPSGRLILLNGTERFFKFSQAGEFLESFGSPYGVGPHGIAVNSAGNIYFVRPAGAVAEVSQSGAEVDFEVDPGPATGLAVDSASDDLYVDRGTELQPNEGTEIFRYDSSGGLLESFGSGHLTGATGLGVGPAAEVDATDTAAGDVAVFALFGPIVTTSAATGITGTEATLHGNVAPTRSGDVTDCRFEYVTSEAFELGGYANPSVAPCTPALPYSASTAVSAVLTGLNGGTTYHFRLAAADSATTEFSSDSTFLTLGPSVDSTSTSEVSATSATLEAELNPHGQATTYHFEYDTTPYANGEAPHGESTPTGSAGEGTADVTRTARLEELAPSTTYHFRVVAENALGTATGPDRTFTTQPASSSTLLPDRRAWELVSPPDKHGIPLSPISGPYASGGLIQAAADGNTLTYVARGSITDAPPGNVSPTESQYLASRSSLGWSTQDITTANEEPTGVHVGTLAEYEFFSTDLSRAALTPKGTTPLSPLTTEPTPYLREPDGTYTPLAIGCPEAPQPCPPVTEEHANVVAGVHFGQGGQSGHQPELEFAGASPDLGSLIVSSKRPLTPELLGFPAQESLFEWSAGSLRLASWVPAGPEPRCAGSAPACVPAAELGLDSRLGFERGMVRGALSADGSRVVFATVSVNGPSGKRLYLRDTSSGETLRLDAAQEVAEPETGEASFQTASVSGGRVFFTDSNRLTPDSTAKEQPDLYMCEVEQTPPGLACTLTDLSANSLDFSEPAAVQGVPGAAADGSSVYFAAKGALTADAAPATCGEAASDSCNLYRYDLASESLSLVAVLSAADFRDWTPGFPGALGNVTSRVSPDGRYLAFMSERPLTGYDNRDAVSGERDEEVFLYDAAANGGEGRLLCASCDPSGARPHGLRDPTTSPPPLYDSPQNWQGRWLAAAIPGWTQFDGKRAQYQARYLSDSGRLFFNAFDALTPADSNGAPDVYQFEFPQGPDQPASNDCTTSSPAYSSASGGCVNLISSGTSGQESAFLDASVTGDDVYFLTAARLDPGHDEDAAYDVYDARAPHVPGEAVGFPAPVKSVECSGDACQQPAVPPAHPTPGTLLQNGPENVKQCPNGKKLQKGKCVKKVRHERNKGKKHKHRAKKHQRKGTVKP